VDVKKRVGIFSFPQKRTKNADVTLLSRELLLRSWNTEGLNCTQDGQRIAYCDHHPPDDDDSDNH